VSDVVQKSRYAQFQFRMRLLSQQITLNCMLLLGYVFTIVLLAMFQKQRFNFLDDFHFFHLKKGE
jgi:hypothetical protein